MVLPGSKLQTNMNFSLASLAVELLLFAAAWLAVGMSVPEHRKACLSWAWGWLLIGLAAVMMFVRPLWTHLIMDVPINFLLLTAFLQIQGGLGQLARRPPHPAYMLATYVGLLAIEFARWQLPGREGLLAWIFAFTLSIPVSGIIMLLWSNAPQWFRRRRTTQMLLIFPVLLTMVVLIVRAWMMTWSPKPDQFNFESTTGFIIAATTAFQVCLGFFNFSLFALVLGAMIRRLDNLSSRDQLTGLYNRRVMLERLAAEHSRFLQGDQAYALAMVDLDHFKQVNDRLGHLAGDKALRTIARRLRGALRDTDVIARFGGDDFLLLMPTTDLASACKQAEHIRTQVCGGPISTSRGNITIGMSIGVSMARQTDVDALPVLARVDTALQQARAQGRNRLRVA